MKASCWFVRPENEFIETFRSLDLQPSDEDLNAYSPRAIT